MTATPPTSLLRPFPAQAASRPLQRLTAFLQRKALREAYWLGFGEIATALGGLAAIRVITELLDPHQFGLLTLAMGIVTLALGCAVGPFLQSAMRLHADHSASDAQARMLRSESLRVIRSFVLLAGLVMTVGGGVFGTEAGTRPWIGIVLAAFLIVDSFRSYETAMLNAARRQKEMSLWQAADAWGRPLAAVLSVWLLGADVVNVLIGYTIISLLINAAFAHSVPLEGKGGRSDAVDDATSIASAQQLRRRIWRLVLPLLPVAFLGWVTSLSDRYIIAGILSMQDAGLYAAAYALVSRPFLMCRSFLDAWLRPWLYEAFSKAPGASIRRIFLIWVTLSFAVGTLGLIGFLALHTWVAQLLLAAPYREAAQLMPWIALGYALAVGNQLPTRICYACNRTDYVLLIEVASAVSAVAATVPAVFWFGLYGAALAVPAYFGAQLAVGILLASYAMKGRAGNLL